MLRREIKFLRVVSVKEVFGVAVDPAWWDGSYRSSASSSPFSRVRKSHEDGAITVSDFLRLEALGQFGNMASPSEGNRNMLVRAQYFLNATLIMRI